MQIPLTNPLASYPQPYATWAQLRNEAAQQRDHGTASGPAQGSAPLMTTSAYTVDAIA